MARKDLAAILLDDGLIAPRDLERVERERAGRPLWSGLLDAGLATEEELFFLLAPQFPGGVATDDLLDQVEVPEVVMRVYGRDEALRAGLLPVEVERESGRGTVVMVDPTDESGLSDFLARAKLGGGRVLLGRRSLIERAIERCYAALDARKTKLVEKEKIKKEAKVEIDPQLAAEMQRLGSRVLKTEPLTPLPRLKKKRHEPAQSPAPPGDDALRAEERLSRALLQSVEVLARELERRLIEAAPDEKGPVADGMARLSRRVARRLGLDRRVTDEIGVAAYLFVVDRRLRAVDGASDLAGELGWASARDEGLLPILRSLTAAAAGFGRTHAGAPPLGARIISLVDDFLTLGVSSAEVDLGTVSQLLRASPAGAQVVDALLHVLEEDRNPDPTPQNTTVTQMTVAAQSLLGADTTPDPDKTQRKPIPRQRSKKET